MTDVQAVEALAARLAARLPGRVATDAPFGARTTWRVGGPAAVVVEVEQLADLAVVAAELSSAVPRIVLGRGSNLLVADAGFAGVVVVLGAGFEAVDVGETTVSAGGATALPVLARRCAAAGRSGLGFYVGIPGSVGGAVRMNAGGHGRETIEVLREATVVDLGAAGLPEVRTPAALGLAYRHSALTDDEIVVAARFEVGAGDPEVLRAELAEIVRWRTEHQPGGANAGSVFRNPPGDAAARLIDAEAGLRGTRVGGAVVSEKHANFIQADAGATAADVHQLLLLVRDRVEARTGVRLVPEVRRIGFEDP
jgi:UDP-N-acetylmuramate dehydrogenase